PYALRRTAHGVFKILVDLPALTGIRAPIVDQLFEATKTNFMSIEAWDLEQLVLSQVFLLKQFEFVLESRGFDPRNVRAITRERSLADIRPSDDLKKLNVLPEFTDTAEFQQLAIAYKRAKNIAKQFQEDTLGSVGNLNRSELSAPSELALLD